MKPVILLLLVILFACNNNDTSKSSSNGDSTISQEAPGNIPEKVKPDTVDKTNEEPPKKEYANTRFRKVTLEKLKEGSYRIRGEAQIFEASFGWVVEDGHNELEKGFTTADMGAPEWGKFDFTIDVKKARPNSTLHLILFETSMKDGSRQHELAIPLG